MLDLEASDRLELILSVPTYPADVFIGARLVGDPSEPRRAVETVLDSLS